MAYIEVPQLDGRSLHMSHSMVIPSNGDYEIKAVSPGCIPKSIFLSVGEIEDEKDRVLGELFFYLNYFDKTRIPKIPEEMISMKLVQEVDSLDIDKDFTLIQLLKQFPGVSLDENNRIFLHGNQVESIRVNGRETGRFELSDSMKNMSAGMIWKVLFSQRELREIFSHITADSKTGPLVMNVVLKEESEDYGYAEPEEEEEDNGKVRWLYAGGVMVVLVIAGLIYFLKSCKRTPLTLEDFPPSSVEDSSEPDELAFRDAFVRRNINGASEEELKKLE